MKALTVQEKKTNYYTEPCNLECNVRRCQAHKQRKQKHAKICTHSKYEYDFCRQRFRKQLKAKQPPTDKNLGSWDLAAQILAAKTSRSYEK